MQRAPWLVHYDRDAVASLLRQNCAGTVDCITLLTDVASTQRAIERESESARVYSPMGYTQYFSCIAYNAVTERESKGIDPTEALQKPRFLVRPG